ncbi:hypothetical protein A3Q56_07058 [Intoshia linei]|uniref:Integrase zinc-binding domain-containing protein n=1 Tax=Intoshia linei TaxID=1819745 RepID=A0A177AT66_9BILA|nr:hypothetical protein A3Q56_07058 [Intoshia linei]
MSVDIIRHYHESKLYVHPGVSKLAKIIIRNVFFPRIFEKVRDFVRNCESCHLSKIQNHKLYKPLKTVKINNFNDL